MKTFLFSIWESLPTKKFCSSCGNKIWGEFRTTYFDHLIDKSPYPQFAYEKQNIYFCCQDCHSKKTGGSPTKEHMKAIEEAKLLFDIK